MSSSVTSTMQTLWSGLETRGMKDAKCSLLLQEDAAFEPKVKGLPKQRVLVYQDKGFNPAGTQGEDNFFVDFKGCTILQLEPSFGPSPQRTMPVTLTVGGRCIFTPENYHDFRVMMRTKEQSQEMDIAPNGNFDWPDVSSMLLCPLCGNKQAIPDERDDYDQEYWMLFYPLLQITVMKGSQMTLGTRTICRLTCLECMENLLEGMSLTVQPGATEKKRTRLCFSLPASAVLAEAGSASFLEDGPPRPETHPHVDDILDAWTLYNLWEHSGAWEALQNDYRIVLSRSMHGESGGGESDAKSTGGRSRGGSRGGDESVASAADRSYLKERLGKACGNPKCYKVHGKKNSAGDIVRLSVKCKECHSEFYCSKMCRDKAKSYHQDECQQKQLDRKERREKKAKRVQCDTCLEKLPYTQMKKCSRCRKATYCSVECQRKAWADHKNNCVKRN